MGKAHTSHTTPLHPPCGGVLSCCRFQGLCCPSSQVPTGASMLPLIAVINLRLNRRGLESFNQAMVHWSLLNWQVFMAAKLCSIRRMQHKKFALNFPSDPHPEPHPHHLELEKWPNAFRERKCYSTCAKGTQLSLVTSYRASSTIGIYRLFSLLIAVND